MNKKTADQLNAALSHFGVKAEFHREGADNLYVKHMTNNDADAGLSDEEFGQFASLCSKAKAIPSIGVEPWFFIGIPKARIGELVSHDADWLEEKILEVFKIVSNAQYYSPPQ